MDRASLKASEARAAIRVYGINIIDSPLHFSDDGKTALRYFRVANEMPILIFHIIVVNVDVGVLNN